MPPSIGGGPKIVIFFHSKIIVSLGYNQLIKIRSGSFCYLFIRVCDDFQSGP